MAKGKRPDTRKGKTKHRQRWADFPTIDQVNVEERARSFTRESFQQRLRSALQGLPNEPEATIE